MTALDVSNYFIEKASEVDENDLTNLKLQKLLYFAQGKFAAQKGTPLFREPIEAWDLGPVVREVYNQFKKCGQFPITVFDTPDATIKIGKETQVFLDSIWDEYGKYSAAYLVGLTHKRNTPWKKHFQRGQSNIIPVDELKEFFS
jgi:uncharacterized phage-associated protein